MLLRYCEIPCHEIALSKARTLSAMRTGHRDSKQRVRAAEVQFSLSHCCTNGVASCWALSSGCRRSCCITPQLPDTSCWPRRPDCRWRAPVAKGAGRTLTPGSQVVLTKAKQQQVKVSPWHCRINCATLLLACEGDVIIPQVEAMQSFMRRTAISRLHKFRQHCQG